MGVTRPAKSGLASAMSLIAKRLRKDSDCITQEPLPEQGLDLIRRIDGQARDPSNRPDQTRHAKGDR
jgi:hypothetical protein